MRAQDLMTTPVVTVGPDTPAKEAVRLLTGHGFAALPVVAPDDRLLGVVSEADLLRNRILPDPRALIHNDAIHNDAPAPTGPPPSIVAEVMTTDVVVAGRDAHAAELSRLMLDRHLRSLPVVDGDRLVGIVSRVDLLRMIARDDDAIARDVSGHLSAAGRRRWDVAVADGVVTLASEGADETDRHIAAVIAGAAPGVVDVRIADDLAGPAHR
jgi:CBS-domain-containing membrane protein